MRRSSLAAERSGVELRPLAKPPRRPTAEGPRLLAGLPATGTTPAARRENGLLLIDFLAIVLATVAAATGAQLASIALGPAAAVVVFDLAVFAGQWRLARHRGLRTSLLDDVARIVAVTAGAAMTVLAARALLWPDVGMAAQAFRLWVFVTIYLMVARVGWEILVRSSGGAVARADTIVLGAGVVGRRVARRLLEDSRTRFRPIGFLDDDPLEALDGHGPPVLGTFADLEREVRRHHVQHVVVCFSRVPHAVLLDILRRSRGMGLSVSVVPRLYEDVTRRVTVDHLGGIAVLQVQHLDPRGWQFAVKYMIDRVLAAVALALLAPVLLLVALAVKLSSRGPILYRCRRVGLDGKEFDLLKFRTMTGSPETHGAFNGNWAARQLGLEVAAAAPVDRRTPLGRWLRRFSVDELPQLFNVLRGDMSLIGPRPERVALASSFEPRVYRYGDRHRVKSGITGWAQIHGLRGDTDLSERIELDNYYIDNWSLWLDLKIALLTIPAMLSGRNAE